MARELLFSVTRKDFEIETFRVGGKGGQHQNKTESGVRIVHKDSGAVGEARDSRSQHINKKEAFNRLVSSPKFKLWIKKRINEELNKTLTEQEVQKLVDDMMKPENLKIEYGVSNE